MKKTPYPLTIFIIILVSIFLSVVIVRLLIVSLQPVTFFEEVFMHAIALSVMMFPILNYLLLEPLIRYGEMHEAAIMDLEKAQTILETRVQERTQALLDANENLKRDISKRESVEKELADSEHRLMAIFNTDPECIAILDRGGIIKDVNIAGLTMMGASSRNQLIDTNIAAFSKTGEKQGIIATVERACDGVSGVFESEVINLKGEHRVLEMHFTPFKNTSNDPTQALCVARDITEHKKLESQLVQSHKMDAIGRLAGGVAHDFNNIITAVIGNASLVLDNMDPTDPNYEEVLIIKDAGNKATKLTKQLLTFSKKQVFNPEQLDINEILTAIGNMLNRILGEDVRLKLDLSDKIMNVYADSGQIEQVIMNLAVNARDAMPAGGNLTIATSSHHFDKSVEIMSKDLEAGDYIVITVTDEGVGLTKGLIDQIFEPFFTTKASGTGLGLSIVYGIVKQLAGWISVYSELNEGTTFKIYLPGSSPDKKGSDSKTPDRILSTSENKVLSDELRGSEKIVVIEDDPAIQKLVDQILTSFGYTIILFNSGGSAIEYVKDYGDTVDLVLTDVILPEMRGPEIVQRIREYFPTIKIMYMSGYSDDRVNEIASAYDGNNFLPKPFTPDEIVRKVRIILDQ